MSRFLTLIRLLLACVSIAGCSLQNGGALISDRAWLLDPNYPNDSPGAQAAKDYVPPVCNGAAQKSTDASRTDIESCVYAMLQVIDVKWVHFQDQLLTSANNSNLATDIALQGLGAAGSFVTGQTTQILHAASAGVAGLRSSVNSDLLYSSTITTILLQMQADRAAVRLDIQCRLKAPPPSTVNCTNRNPYASLYEAANDLFAYSRAGSWTQALLSIQKSASTSTGNHPTAATAPTTPTTTTLVPAAPRARAQTVR